MADGRDLPLEESDDVGDLNMMESTAEIPVENEQDIDKPAHDPASPMQEAIAQGCQAYRDFLTAHTCYHLIPQSSKMIVFDTSLLVKKAFFALLQNGVRSAPVWDHRQQKFVGIVTITDFINVLRVFYQSDSSQLEKLQEHRIQTWRDNLNLPSNLVKIDPKDTLLTCVDMLLSHNIHRLPAIDSQTGNVLFIVTHKRILGYIQEHFLQALELKMLDYSLAELGIGTYGNIVTVQPDTPIIEALDLFVEKRVSALPVVDSNGVLVDVYAKFDVMSLARESAYTNLHISIKDALAHRVKHVEGLHTCYATDSLRSIVDQLVRSRVHRLIVVDGENKVTGIVSLSDLLKFLTKFS